MRIDGITFKQEGAIDKMSDNSRPAQVGADNPNIVLSVSQHAKRLPCALCGTPIELCVGAIAAAHLNGYFGTPDEAVSGAICGSCLRREAPSLHALLKPPFPDTIVKQTVTHHTELADGSTITHTYNAARVETKIKDGEYRLKMRGTLDGTEDR